METGLYKEKHPIVKFFTEEPSAWKTLIVINVLVFILGEGVRMFTGSDYFAFYGAKMNFYIADMQIYRFITSMFLHADAIHLLMNCYAIYVLGKAIEQIMGTKKFLVIYFVAGIFGSIASFILTPNPSVGASGGIFGFFGVHIYLYLRKPEVYKQIFGTSIFTILAINLVFGFTNGRIDNFAHIGGLVGGLLASFAVGLRYDNAKQAKQILISALVFILIISSATFGIATQRNTAEFYFAKSYLAFEADEITDGEQYLLDGIEKFPLDEDLNKLYTWYKQNS